MSGAPTVVVKLDNFSTTFPFDISASVRQIDGLNWMRGRGDELSTNQPGALSFTLENTDGRFTLGSTGLIGGAGIKPDLGIRVIVNGSTRWTGKVQSWPVSWPGGGDTFCVVKAVATDALAFFSRQPLRSATTEEILLDSPAAYYPLSDTPLVGAYYADVTGQAPLLAGTFGPGPSGTVTSGTSLQLPDGSQGVLLTGSGINSLLLKNTVANTWNSTNSVHFDIVVRGNLGASPATTVLTLDLASNNAVLTIASTGVASFTASAVGVTVTSPGSTIVGNRTQVITINGDNTATDMWVDGVKVATGAGITGTWSNSRCTLGDALNLAAGATLTLGHFNFGAKVADARIIAHHNAILNDFLGETPAQRITRLFTYLPGGGLISTLGTLGTLGDTILGAARQGGQSLGDALTDVANADQGTLFVDKTGATSYITGTSTIAAITPAATIDANYFSEDTTVLGDLFGIVNYATGLATGSTNTPTVAQSASSQTVHGRYAQDYTWNVSTDAQAADRTNWKVQRYAEAVPRIGTLTLDLLTATPAIVTAALTLDLGSLLRITGLPAQAINGVTQADFIIEGIDESIDLNSWTLTLNVSPKSVRSAWILDDTTYSVLDSTTRVYI